MGLEMPEGMFQQHNGINIFQTRDYVKVGAESYINQMMQMHGWDLPKHKISDLDANAKLVPLNPATVNKLMTLVGPPKKSVEAQLLAKANGFSCRNVLSKLIYAYVICRLDIGYAVCFLARLHARQGSERSLQAPTCNQALGNYLSKARAINGHSSCPF